MTTVINLTVRIEIIVILEGPVLDLKNVIVTLNGKEPIARFLSVPQTATELVSDPEIVFVPTEVLLPVANSISFLVKEFPIVSVMEFVFQRTPVSVIPVGATSIVRFRFVHWDAVKMEFAHHRKNVHVMRVGMVLLAK